MQPLSIRRRQLAIGASPTAWKWTSAVRRRRERRLFPSSRRSPRHSPSPPAEVLDRTRCISPWWGIGVMLAIAAILVWLWLPSVASDCVAEGLVARCRGPGPGAQTTDVMVETVILDGQLWTPTSHVLQHLFPNFQEIWCRRDNSKCTREVVFRHSCSCLGRSILEVGIGEPDLNKDPAVQPDQGHVKATTTFPWIALSLSFTRPFPPPVPVTGATPLSLPSPNPSLENATVKMGAVPTEPTQPTQAESGVIGAPAWLGKVEILLIGLAFTLVSAILACWCNATSSGASAQRCGSWRRHPEAGSEVVPDPVPHQPESSGLVQPPFVAVPIEEISSTPAPVKSTKGSPASNIADARPDSSTPFRGGERPPPSSALEFSTIDAPDGSPCSRSHLRPRALDATFVKSGRAVQLPVSRSVLKLSALTEGSVSEDSLHVGASMGSDPSMSVVSIDGPNNSPIETVCLSSQSEMTSKVVDPTLKSMVINHFWGPRHVVKREHVVSGSDLVLVDAATDMTVLGTWEEGNLLHLSLGVPDLNQTRSSDQKFVDLRNGKADTSWSFFRKKSAGDHILSGPIGVTEDHAATTLGQNWDVEPTPLTDARNDKTLFGDGDLSEGGAAAAGERDLAVESPLDTPTTGELEGLTPIGFVGLMKANDSG